jgi:uncharacterized protein (DUF427 family)
MRAASNPAPGFVRNPDKRITVAAHAGAVEVSLDGTVIASSKRAKLLTEAPYPPVLYIPFADIRFEQLEKTTRSTHCPYKGDASYWSVKPAGEKGLNAMWAYETPFDEMAAIRDHGAFYADRVTITGG